MKRRWVQLLVFGVVILAPVLAWAAGNCVDGGGSDTARFQTILAEHGALVAVLASFGAGFLASLTPCVYPMVPITVSLFGATSASRRRGALLSFTFVLGIAALFTPMGVLSALSGRLMGGALSSPWVVSVLALLFAALAASMFGAFELALPSRITNRLAAVGGIGFRGAFTMGLVMGLIAAPCTGPFLTGIVAVIALSRNVALGSASLFAFALGLGVVFFLTGAFAVRLPKGGAWMMAIKWVSGVGLAYMSFAYLRDRFTPVRHLVAHADVRAGVVAASVLAVGIILGGVHILAERRGSSIAGWSRGARLASIVPAVLGALLFFSWLPLEHGGAPGIAWRFDEATALAEARAARRSVLVDFGASWCPGCNTLEETTFRDPRVRAQADRFIAVKIDLSKDDGSISDRIKAEYGVRGLPVVLLLDGNGTEVIRFNEPVDAERLYAAMKCKAPKLALLTPLPVMQ